MIGPGTYRLTRTVKNPAPDRRCRHDWRAEIEWPEGTLFIVTQYRTGTRALRRQCSYSHQEVREDYDDSGRFARVALALELVQEEPSDYLARESSPHRAGSVLDILYRRGFFMLADVERALEDQNEDREPAAGVLEAGPLPSGELLARHSLDEIDALAERCALERRRREKAYRETQDARSFEVEAVKA